MISTPLTMVAYSFTCCIMKLDNICLAKLWPFYISQYVLLATLIQGFLAALSSLSYVPAISLFLPTLIIIGQ